MVNLIIWLSSYLILIQLSSFETSRLDHVTLLDGNWDRQHLIRSRKSWDCWYDDQESRRRGNYGKTYQLLQWNFIDLESREEAGAHDLRK